MHVLNHQVQVTVQEELQNNSFKHTWFHMSWLCLSALDLVTSLAIIFLQGDLELSSHFEVQQKLLWVDAGSWKAYLICKGKRFNFN